MAETKQIPVAAVVGVGPGLGAALARRFAQGYAVAITARNTGYLQGKVLTDILLELYQRLLVL